MMQILPAKQSNNRRGFTLIEMVAVITIIVLLALIIAPNLVQIKQSRDIRDEQETLLRLPTEVRNAAVKAKTAVSLRVDGDEIVMEKTDPTTSDVQTLKRVPLGAFQVTGAQSGKGSSDLASWKWQAYPDGTSDTGGLTFRTPTNGQAALWMPADGAAQWTLGELPQPSDNSWTAGELEQRTTSTTTTTTGATGAK